MTANHEHTPTPEVFRRDYKHIARHYFITAISREQALAEYDRMIAQVEAAAEQRGAARGWDEAMTKQIQRLISGDPDAERFQMPANPYRADQEVDDDD